MQKNNCNYYNISGHNDEKFWIIHAGLKPQGNNRKNRNNGHKHNYCGELG